MQKCNELSSGSLWSATDHAVNDNSLPDGKTSFSLTMTWRRRGAARKTLPISSDSRGLAL